MDFSRVTAMSYGGRSVSSVWLRGVKVWPATTTYYFPFRLIQDGSYLTWSQFQSKTWGIELYDESRMNSISFNQNDVGHLADGNGRTVFYLSTTSQDYVSPVLQTSDWEHSSGPITPATTNTLAAFNSVGIEDIEGIYTGSVPEGIPIYVSDGQYTCAGYCNNPILQWSVYYDDADTGDTVYLSECVVNNGTEINTGYVGNNFSCAWGSDPNFNVFYLPYSMTDQTVRFYYSFDCHIDTYSPYYGYVDVYVSSSDTEIHVQLPTLSGSV